MNVRDQVESYIEYKRGVGVRMVSEASALRQLARHAASVGHEGPIDVRLAVSWATSGEGHERAYECKRYELARRVCDYHAALGSGCQRLPPGLLGHAKARVTPYIFDDEEVSLLMRASSRLYSQRDPLRPLATELVVGLMRATGMRPSEVLGLEDGDFDVGAGTIVVRSPKSGRDRLLPLSPTVVDALSRYRGRRDRLRSGTRCGRLVVAGGDRPCGLESMERAFCEVRAVLLGRGEVWERRPPRLYDLRHTMAVRTLLGWHAEGRDVNAMLPILSTWLGHAKVSDTYWYLTGTPELMDVAARAFERMAGRDAP